MAGRITTCPNCQTRNRVPVVSSGHARCANCKQVLPWLVDVAESEFDSMIRKSSLPVLVDLWAPWCGPCQTIAPALEQLAADRAGALRVAKVNVDNAPNLSAKLGVQGIPTMVLYKGGNEIARQVGALPGAKIAQWADAAIAAAPQFRG